MRAIRKAFLRGLCLGGLLVFPGAVIGAWHESSMSEPWVGGLIWGALAGLLGGLITGPSTLPELLVSRHEPITRQRELEVAGATALLTIVAVVFAWAQVTFTVTVLFRGSYADAFTAIRHTFERVESLVLVSGLTSLAFVGASLSRLHGRGIVRELLVAYAMGAVVTVPTIVAAFLLGIEGETLYPFIVPGFVNALGVGMLSWACRLAERLDGSLEAHLTGEHPPAPVAKSTRRKVRSFGESSDE